jgi:pyruvyltransferase
VAETSRSWTLQIGMRIVILIKQFSQTPNAGDLASAPIVSYVSSNPVEVMGDGPAEGPNLIAIGSILHWADQHSIIWGTGFIDEYIQLTVKPKSVLAVRGYLTWERLRQQGVSSPQIFGDPGIFLPRLFPKQAARWPLGIVPHYVDQTEPFVLQAAAAGAKIIDVTAPLDQYADALSSCERILSSSLHGLIFAHAYGILGAWIKLSNRVVGDGFKFFDYYSSVGIKKNDVPILTTGERLEALSQRCHVPVRPIDEGALRCALASAL